MSNKSTTRSIRINISGAMLGMLFIILKLCGVIDWSWIWVTAPFWAGAEIAIVMPLGMLLLGLLALLIAAIAK